MLVPGMGSRLMRPSRVVAGGKGGLEYGWWAWIGGGSRAETFSVLLLVLAMVGLSLRQP